MTKRAPKIALGLVLGAASLALAVLGVELALRAAGYDPRAEALAGRTRLVRPAKRADLGYELVPGARGTGWGTEVVVNSLGFRGPEPLDEPGRTRIACLGDSVTFGNDLAFEDTWPERLERALAEHGIEVETLNLALGGYDTVQEVAALEDKGLGLDPAHVVVGFCVNDLGLVSMSMETPFTEADRDDPLFLSRLAQWWRVRTADRAQRRALHERNREANYARAFAAEILPLPEDPLLHIELQALRSAVTSAPEADQDLATRRIPPRWFASEARLGRLEYAFARLARLADEQDFGVTLLLVPYLEDDAWIARGYALVRRLAETHGFTVVDPQAAFRARGLASLRIRSEDPVHPCAEGHELLARALAASLSERAAHAFDG